MLSQRKIGVVLGYVNILAKNLVNLIYTPMLLSFVGKADYGVYQTANSFVFSLTILSFGFSTAYIRFYTQAHTKGSEEDVRKLNGMYLTLYAIICCAALTLGCIFSANVDVFFQNSFSESQVELARILMYIMTINVTATLFSTVFDACIAAHEEFRFQQSRQLVTTLATPIFAYGFLTLHMGAVGVALAQLLIVFVLLGLNIRYAIGKLNMRFSVRNFDKKLFLALMAFSAWIFLNQVCDMVNQSLPNVLLGALTSASVVAVFSVSIQIRSVFYSLSTTISGVFAPLINRLVVESDDNKALTRLMTQVGRYQMLLFAWVYGGFVILGHFFIRHWAGETFEDAYWLVLAMTLPLAIPLCQNTGIEIQRAKNRHKARSVAMLIMAVFNVVFTVLTSPMLGYWSPAIGYAISIALGNGLFMNWYYQKVINLDMVYFWGKVLPIFIASVLSTVLCFFGTSLLPVNSWLSFIVWGAVYSALFALVAFVFVLDNDERHRITSHLPFLR